MFASNPTFIFHDSRGFEAGSVEELEAVKSFISTRAAANSLKEQLHAIWYDNYIRLYSAELPACSLTRLKHHVGIAYPWMPKLEHSPLRNWNSSTDAILEMVSRTSP